MVEYQAAVIQDVCAWPNLTVLPDGTVVAAIFNQPAHGSMPGDVDCWASRNLERTWQKQGTAASRPSAKANRMNVGAGLANDGDLLVISSGYCRIGEEATWDERLLPAIVCRSGDGGATWTASEEFPTSPDGQHMIPFGDILAGADRALRVTAYTARDLCATYMISSPDDGRTWQNPVTIAQDINECAPLHLGDGRWLAAARTITPADVRLFTSADDGASWADRGPVTEGRQHPAHLMRLADGRILLTYGNRQEQRPGVEAILSSDEGATWGEPLRLIELPMVDLGYPSSAQLADGNVLTAYYASSGPGYDGYHMGVVIWRLPSAD